MEIVKKIFPYLWVLTITVACSVLPSVKPFESSPSPVTIPTQITRTATGPFQRTSTPVEKTPTVPATEALPPETVLTLWHSKYGEEAQAIYESVSAFQKTNPQIRLKVVYVPYDDLLARYQTALASGDEPWMMIAPGEWAATLFEAGQIADLAQLVPQGFFLRINPAASGIVRQDDAILGVPFSIRGIVMYRNASIVTSPSTTFNELIASARDATRGRFVGAYLDRGAVFGAAQLSACGGVLVDESGYPTFNNETGLCWLELLRAFEEAGPVTFNTEDDYERFMDQRIGVIIDGTWKLDQLAQTLGDHLVIDPWPAYDDGRLSGFVWADCFYLDPGLSVNEQKTAWKLIESLLGEQAQTTLSEFGILPAVVDLQVADLHIQQAMLALSQGIPYPAQPEIEFYWGPLNLLIYSVLADQVDPATALQVAHDQIMAEIVKNR